MLFLTMLDKLQGNGSKTAYWLKRLLPNIIVCGRDVDGLFVHEPHFVVIY